MGRILAIVVSALLSAALVLAQQGGAGGGGPQGRGGGAQQEQYDGSVYAIERAISTYLDGNEIKNILTPGEYSEWTLPLKAGQVVIAEARSEAFDPALEIVDGAAKVLASNDDRYPGDQRPLLLWRCEVAGTYAIRARSFQNKAGGQFFLRFRTYDSVDAGSEAVIESTVKNDGAFLIRVPMKAGQIKQIYFELPNPEKYMRPSLGITISPIGLPDIGLSRSLNPIVSDVVMAPVDGNYYVVANPGGWGGTLVRIGTREITPSPLTAAGETRSAKAPNNAPRVWTLSVKKGEVLEVSTPELDVNSRLVLAEEPDISKFDLKKPETNPFFPHTAGNPQEEMPAFMLLPSRSRDGRILVFAALRDAKLWVGTNAAGEKDKHFTLTVKPAPKELPEAAPSGNKLRIGNTDYWAFEAKVGDVMTFNSTATGFAEDIVFLDPDFAQIRHWQAQPDQMSTSWNHIVSKPGRHLVAISSIGGGGGGDYSLARKVFRPKEFGKGTPARGTMEAGQVQVWKFTAKPEEPLLIRWNSSDWNYSIAIRNEMGHDVGLPLTHVDEKNRFGILKVQKPTTFLIVLIPGASKAQYSIELNDLPGYGK
jgi:hypothetical protein